MPKFRVFYTTTHVIDIEAQSEETAIKKAHTLELHEWDDELEVESEAEEITDDE